jgi:hypothetical protein
MMNELVETVARTAGLSPEQASRAVAAMLNFCTGRLPSALVGELHARLRVPPTCDAVGTEPERGATP